MNERYPKEVLRKTIVLRFPMNIFVNVHSLDVLKNKFKMLKEIPHSVKKYGLSAFELKLSIIIVKDAYIL